MAFKSIRDCVEFLESEGQLIRVQHEVDPNLDIACIQRDLYAAKGPAVLFENVKGSPFPVVTNIFGTQDRTELIFRDTLAKVSRIVKAKVDPMSALKQPWTWLESGLTALTALPRPTFGNAPVMANETAIDKIPAVKSWPNDGGPFITLPQVLSQDPYSNSVMKTNLGMYRVQLSGNEYTLNKEIGLHYQIHRGIGVHHSRAIEKNEPLKVSIFIGGPPAHTFAAVMPLPEGLTELTFAGMLAGRAFRYARWQDHLISAEADFCIVGKVHGVNTKPEGPFGDHLGYYSLKHSFPVLEVEKVFHRDGAIWPITVVGRPPQEDTSFGKLIHKITKPAVPSELPGVRALHAVDEAGVHPLLLAIGSERYVPYEKRVPKEIITIANSILGFGQTSLAKYLFIAAGEDTPTLNVDNTEEFFRHLLERVRFSRDLHFHTQTTIDTLDYSSEELNQGSKLVIAVAGEKVRKLATEVPAYISKEFEESGWKIRIVMDGVVAVSGPKFSRYTETQKDIEQLRAILDRAIADGESSILDEIPLIILADDAEFVAQSIANFLWVTFTRSNPSHDISGYKEAFIHKHWACEAPMIIDARIKPHHAPALVEDSESRGRVVELYKRDIGLGSVLSDK